MKLAKVTPYDEIYEAESFLIRISYNNQRLNLPLLLQNINGTTPYNIPSDGLTITHTANSLIPSYFKNKYGPYTGGNQI